MPVSRKQRKKIICKWTNKWLLKKQFILRSLCIMQQKINTIGPLGKGLKRFISDAQLHRRTLSELAMKNDRVTLAGVYRGEKKSDF